MADIPPPAARFTRSRTLAYLLVIFGTFILLLEAGARLVYFAKHDWNPYYLTFGFVADIERNSDRHGGYTTFQPNTIKRQEVRGKIVPIRINNLGFRSLTDWEVPKPPGTFRVATIGASSTFGYQDTDTETYPYYLEQMLGPAWPHRTIEVLNLGIPQSRMTNMLALARAEFPRLEPDLVTFYEGFNNAMMPRARAEAGILYRIKDWFYYHSVGWRTVHVALKNVYHKVTGHLNADLLGAHGLDLPIRLPTTDVDSIAALVSNEFASDLGALVEYCRSLGVPIILVTQSYSLYFAEPDPTLRAWTSYREEQARLHDRYRGGEGLTGVETVMFAHGQLMDTVRALAERSGMPILEGITILDHDREANMASHVHLTPVGNRRLARGILEVIRRYGLIDSTAPAPLAPTR